MARGAPPSAAPAGCPPGSSCSAPSAPSPPGGRSPSSPGPERANDTPAEQRCLLLPPSPGPPAGPRGGDPPDQSTRSADEEHEAEGEATCPRPHPNFHRKMQPPVRLQNLFSTLQHRGAPSAPSRVLRYRGEAAPPLQNSTMSHTGQSYLGLLTLVLHTSLAAPAGWCPALSRSDPQLPWGGAEPAAEREGDSESTLAGVPAHRPLGAPRARRAAPPCLRPHLTEGAGHRLPETPRPSQVISQLLWVAGAKTRASCHLCRLRGPFQEPLCTEKRAPRVTRGGLAWGQRHTVTMTTLRLYGHTEQSQRAWTGRARTQAQSPRPTPGPERHVRGQHHACPLCQPSTPRTPGQDA